VRFIGWIVLGALILTTLACEQGDRHYNELAVYRDAAGDIEVVYKPCHHPGVTSVRFVEIKGGVIGDDDDRTLWEIRSRGLQQDHFTVGKTPEDFSEVVKVIEAPTGKEPFGFIVTKVGGWRQMKSFHLDQLRTDKLFLDKNRYLTRQEFVARDNCP
jgi:hypothetical protein